MDDAELEQSERHKQFLLVALRAASARAKLMDADITTIGVALKSDLIGPDTAVSWIHEAGLLWMVGALPETVNKISRTTTQQEQPNAENAAG